jgi:glycosyltransferase involved in cell wall biosynthesis
MRVLITDLASRTNNVGGEARVAAQLFDGLKGEFDTYYVGFDTSFMSKKGPNKIILERKLPVGAKTRKLPISELKIMRLAYNLVFVRRMKWLGLSKAENKAIMDIKPQVIIANSISDYPLLHYLKRQGLKFKAIYVDHGSISTTAAIGRLSNEAMPLTVGTGLGGSSVEDTKSRFFNFFDLTIALNKRQYSAIKGFTSKVAYIPNGLVVPITSTSSSKRRFAERYGITPKDFVVLYIGRFFERQKRVKTLIDAFKRIRKEGFKLLLIGQGPSTAEYVDMSKGDDRIIFTGSLSDNGLSDAYEVSDVTVIPSAWEGFTLVLLEAAAHSLPMVLSDGAYIEDLKIKEIGEIPHFPTGDSAKLAELLSKLKSDKKFLAKATSSSKAIARTFTAKKTLQLYKKAIESLA